MSQATILKTFSDVEDFNRVTAETSTTPSLMISDDANSHQQCHTDAGCGRVALSQKKWSHSSNQEARDMNRLAAHGSAPRKWHVQIPQRPVLGLAGVLLAR